MSNRWPVMNATEKTFQDGISALNQRKLAEAEQLFIQTQRSEHAIKVRALSLKADMQTV